MTETKQTSTTKTDRRPDCVTEIRMGNSVLTMTTDSFSRCMMLCRSEEHTSELQSRE